MSDLSTSQAAARLGVARNTLLRWLRERRIPEGRRDRNGWRVFSLAEVDELSRRLSPAPTAAVLDAKLERMCAYLRRVPFFASLPAEVLVELAQVAQFRGLLKGQHVFQPGDAPKGLYVVVKGRVRVVRTSADGKEQTLALVVPFQTLGESTLFGGSRHSSLARCLEGSTVVLLPTHAVRRLTLNSPQLAQAFLREFSRRIEDLEDRLEGQTLLSLEQRVARYLLDPDRPTLRLGEMASFLGAARETVSRMLARWEKSGWISRGGSAIAVLEEDQLREI